MHQNIAPNVLIISNKQLDAKIYRSSLSYPIQLEIAESSKNALDIICQSQAEVLVLDLERSDSIGLEICRAIRSSMSDSYIGIVFITSTQDPELLEHCLSAGADSVGYRNQLHLQIGTLVMGAFRVRQTMLELKEANARLERAKKNLKQFSLSDEVSGLYNMPFMHRQTHSEFKRAERYQKPLSLILLDLSSHEKNCSALNGATKAKILTAVAKEINSSIRHDIDFAARSSDEEFMILLPETDKQGAIHVANRIKMRVATMDFGENDFFYKAKLALGLATFDGADKNMLQADELTLKAEIRMHKARDLGENAIVSADFDLETQARRSAS